MTLCTPCPTSNMAKSCSGASSRDHGQLFQHMRVQKIQNCNRYGAIYTFIGEGYLFY